MKIKCKTVAREVLEGRDHRVFACLSLALNSEPYISKRFPELLKCPEQFAKEEMQPYQGQSEKVVPFLFNNLRNIKSSK